MVGAACQNRSSTLGQSQAEILFQVSILYRPQLIAFRNTSLPIVPRNSLLKLDPTATEDIQRAADSQINLAIAQLLHQFQVLQVASTTCVCHGNGADGSQELHELGVDAGLFAFDVGGVDQEFCAMWLEEGDVFLLS